MNVLVGNGAVDVVQEWRKIVSDALFDIIDYSSLKGDERKKAISKNVTRKVNNKFHLTSRNKQNRIVVNAEKK